MSSQPKQAVDAQAAQVATATADGITAIGANIQPSGKAD